MQHLHRRAIWLFFFSYMRYFGIFVLIWIATVILGLFAGNLSGLGNAGSSIEGAAWGIFFPILVALLLVCYLTAYLTWHFYTYSISDDGFHRQQGILFKQSISVPCERIQNVDIYRNIVHQLLGLSDLQIQTAGTEETQSLSRLPGIGAADAGALRDELMRRAEYGAPSQVRAAEASSTPPEPPASSPYASETAAPPAPAPEAPPAPPGPQTPPQTPEHERSASSAFAPAETEPEPPAEEPPQTPPTSL